jgi:photosystem II stability/assembly factor-like uncharacterized protein
MRKVILLVTVLIFTTLHSNSQGWFQQQSGTTANLNSVFFIDANTGWAVGDSASSFHVILKTTNGGTNWFRLNINPTNTPNLKTVFFLDANTGFIFGGNAPFTQVFKTTNAGLNWAPLGPFSSTLWLNSIYFTNINTGFGAGHTNMVSGQIVRTTDGGGNWVQQSPGGTNLFAIHFANANTGYICGSPGVVLKTTNSGSNWVQQTFTFSVILRSIYFINPLTGWTVGTNSRVYKTADGGNVWVDLSSTFLCGLYSVYFTNDMTGWVAGCEGAIHRTTNGGANWTMQSFGGTTYLYSMSFVNANTGWAVGAGGRILKTTNGGVTAITPINTEAPNEFKLEQNYPNPFNPGTNIKFQIPKQGYTELRIFDILGKEIGVLVNARLNPGTYKVDWDASGYPSGVYYCKLTAGDFTESKKMVLIK